MTLFLPEFEAEAVAIATIDKLFDVLNGSSAYDVKPERRGFGVTPEVEEVQREVLKKGAELIRNATKVDSRTDTESRVRKRRQTKRPRKLLPFQNGFLRNIASLLGLLEDVRRCGLTFVMTAHVNQDLLENLFSQLRAM